MAKQWREREQKIERLNKKSEKRQKNIISYSVHTRRKKKNQSLA